MIIGLCIRNYKCYSNINFIPLAKAINEKLTVFIGDNGIGKSAILESLHCLLNNVEPKQWEITYGQKKDRTFICPVFLIKKDEFNPTPEEIAISDAFWINDFGKLNNSEAMRELTKYRDELKSKIDQDQYLFFCLGKNTTGDVLFTSTLHQKLFDQTKRLGVSKQKIIDLFHKILNFYTYVYIPTENRISDVLSLQSSEMQALMDKSVTDEIRSILSEKKYPIDQPRKNSIVDLINHNLDDYIESINSKISQGYKFEPKSTYKKTVKANDILHAILKEYFSIRILKKDNKNIRSLSSGQQRIALMDVSITLLSNYENKNTKIILAIDEPENSLEASHRFEQFSRLVNIAEKYNHQVLVTTHWYGLLLKPSPGRLNFISSGTSAPELLSYPLNNLYDHRRRFPNSIDMKSYFDLMTSMLSILKRKKYTWIICEGYEDSLYLNLYLKEYQEDTYILPFNGCGNIKKLYKLLSVPFDDEYERDKILGKVLLLIDTDEKSLLTIQGYKSGRFQNKLIFERFMLDREKDESKLISIADPTASNTEIEDVLDTEIMWETLQHISKTDPFLSDNLANYTFDNKYKHCDITKEAKFLKRENLAGHEKFPDLKNYLATDDMKRKIAESYTNIALKKDALAKPMWIDTLISYLP
jgi:ABC-type cobalamin/Fe3+-siderophores transport system ATPase subunit